MTTVRIPGKVMLSGEYAVLYGGTAVVIPVDRWLSATSEPALPKDQPSLMIRTAMTLPIEELATAFKPRPRDYPVIDSSGFFAQTADGSVKLGLGASAAEAVAAIALRFELAGLPWLERRDLVFQYAKEAHTKAQAGIGSGADVAACCYGIPLYYRLEQNRGVPTPVILPSRTKHPASLVWTGKHADTRAQVARFNAWVNSGGANVKELISRLIKASHDVSGEWFKASWDDLYEMLTEFVVILTRCTLDAGVPYKIPAHREIESWALRHGGKAKPVGAGGGDMVLVLGDLPYEELEQPGFRISI